MGYSFPCGGLGTGKPPSSTQDQEAGLKTEDGMTGDAFP